MVDNSYLLKYGIMARNVGVISLYLHVTYPERYPEFYVEADMER